MIFVASDEAYEMIVQRQFCVTSHSLPMASTCR